MINHCYHLHNPFTEQTQKHELPHKHAYLIEIDEHRPKQKRALTWCVILTLLMMIIEFAAGIISKSLMLISDAIHMLSHASSLLISLAAILLANKNFGDKFTFGIYRIEILAALLNGITLAVFTVWIIYEAIGRIVNPVIINNSEMLLVATTGLLVNFITAFLLHRSGIDDINTKSAFFHMLADTYSSIAIIAGGIVISLTNYFVIDPIISLVVALLVARWSLSLLRDSVMIMFERIPSHIKIEDIKSNIMKQFTEIKDVHDIHIWEITSQFICFSAHIVTNNITLKESDFLRHRIEHVLKEQFGICHLVIQFECF